MKFHQITLYHVQLWKTSLRTNFQIEKLNSFHKDFIKKEFDYEILIGNRDVIHVNKELSKKFNIKEN